MTVLLALLGLAAPARAATYAAEVDATPAVAPGSPVHVVMTLRGLETSLNTPPVFCVTTPAGWRPQGAVGALRPRRGTPKARPMALGGLPGDQLDATTSGEGWACVVGRGRRWRQGASGSVVFTLLPPAHSTGIAQLHTAVGRFDRSVHIGDVLTIAVQHSAPVHSDISADPLLARRVFDALDELDVFEIEASSLTAQLALRQPPPLRQRLDLIERVAQRQQSLLHELAAPLPRPLPGYEATFNTKKAAVSDGLTEAAGRWLERSCAHKQRILSEPPDPAHHATIGRIDAELSALGPALSPWWTQEHEQELTRCTALSRSPLRPGPLGLEPAAPPAVTAPSPP